MPNGVAMKFLFELGSKHRKVVLILIGMALVPLAYVMLRLEIVNKVEMFFAPGDEQMIQYETFKKRYGGERIFAVAFKDQDIFTARNLKFIADLTALLSATEGIREVLGLTNAKLAIASGDNIDIRSLVPESTLTQSYNPYPVR